MVQNNFPIIKEQDIGAIDPDGMKPHGYCMVQSLSLMYTLHKTIFLMSRC